jgi:hypothetical protein
MQPSPQPNTSKTKRVILTALVTIQTIIFGFSLFFVLYVTFQRGYIFLYRNSSLINLRFLIFISALSLINLFFHWYRLVKIYSLICLIFFISLFILAQYTYPSSCRPPTGPNSELMELPIYCY